MSLDKEAPAVIHERVGGAQPKDMEIWDRIEAAYESGGLPLRDLLEAFPLYTRRVNMGRFLAHYELYKMIADLPGSIVEVGVYRGASLLTWAKLLEIFHAGDRRRKVIGFDNFAGFVTLTDEDGPERPQSGKVLGGWNGGPYYDELMQHVHIFHDDSYVPRAKRIEIIAGNVEDTAAQYAEEHPGLRISLLHIDVDLYTPTLATLRAFYPLVVNGGLVIFDEYGIEEFGGESAAVEEYFGRNMPELRKFPFSTTPGAFIVKGGGLGRES